MIDFKVYLKSVSVHRAGSADTQFLKEGQRGQQRYLKEEGLQEKELREAEFFCFRDPKFLSRKTITVLL
jgi:hypothetical protein